MQSITESPEVKSTLEDLKDEVLTLEHTREVQVLMSQFRVALANARFEVFGSIRDNVRNLPSDRHAEIFEDFRDAVESNDLGYLADTVLNWALGGHGYDYAGDQVSRLTPVVSRDDDPETKELWNAFWSGHED